MLVCRSVILTGHACQIEVADVAEFPKQGWFVDTIFPKHQAFRYKKTNTRTLDPKSLEVDLIRQ